MAAFLQGSYPGDATTYLDGTGNWSIPAGSGSGSGGAVASVNGKTGTVTLTAADVSADPAGAATAAVAGLNLITAQPTDTALAYKMVDSSRLVVSSQGGDDAPALQAMVNQAAADTVTGRGGFLRLGPFDYKLKSRVSVPHQMKIEGCGSATRLMPTGSGGIYMHDNANVHGANNLMNRTGILRDFTLDGTNCTVPCIALDFGDGWGFLLEGIRVENFNTYGSIGIRFANDAYYTEKTWMKAVVVRNCAMQMYINSTVPSDVSKGYNDIELSIYMLPNNTTDSSGKVLGQYGIILDGGTNFYNSSFRLRGNSQTVTAAFPAPASGLKTEAGTAMPPICEIALIGDNGNGQKSTFSRSHLDIQTEGDGGNPFAPIKLYYGTAGHQIEDCQGFMIMTGGNNGSSNTNGTSGQLQFAGIVKGSDLQAIVTKPADLYGYA
jgi:hypothetical protein